MGGETRRQRRDARRASGDGSRVPEPRTPDAVPVVGGGDLSPSAAGLAPAPDTVRRGFVRESVGELKKVEWPSRAQVIQGTIVVIIACAIVGAFLWGVDQALRPFVRDILIG